MPVLFAKTFFSKTEQNAFLFFRLTCKLLLNVQQMILQNSALAQQAYYYSDLRIEGILKHKRVVFFPFVKPCQETRAALEYQTSVNQLSWLIQHGEVLNKGSYGYKSIMALAEDQASSFLHGFYFSLQETNQADPRTAERNSEQENLQPKCFQHDGKVGVYGTKPSPAAKCK